MTRCRDVIHQKRFVPIYEAELMHASHVRISELIQYYVYIIPDKRRQWRRTIYHVASVLCNNTYGFGATVMLRLSRHCKSVTRLVSGTSGRHVNISDLPTGRRCTDWMGRISRRGCFWPLTAAPVWMGQRDGRLEYVTILWQSVEAQLTGHDRMMDRSRNCRICSCVCCAPGILSNSAPMRAKESK